MLIKEKICVNAKTETTKKHIEQLFGNVDNISLEEIGEKVKEIIIYEIDKDDDLDEVKKLFKTDNFFLFISEECHDELLLKLSEEFFFMFTLRDDPVNEIMTRFNSLKKHREMNIELEKKSDELESTIFELAFASTNVLEQNEFLEQMAKKDGLTMLFNHSYFKDKLKGEMTRSARYSNDFTLALLDLDYFKKVNDQYGHVKGDEVLKAFAKIITESIRNTDIAARYGGEEFAIIFTETGVDEAVNVINRIRENLDNTVFESDSECFKITFSAGITPYDKRFKDVEFMVDTVDKGLYISKSSGRNRTTILTYEDINN
jgi:diguanylate cyclase (GGDEF)-like protein